MSLDLRPLTIGELFDRAFGLYRRHFWLFVGITAVPGVFALFVTLLQTTVQDPRWQQLEAGSPELEAAMGGLVWAMAGMMIGLVAYFVVYMVALGATTYAVSEVYLGRQASVAEVYSRMRGRIGALLWLLTIVVFRVMGLLILAMFVGGLAVAVQPVLGGLVLFVLLLAAVLLASLMMLRYGVSVPALVLEGKTARASLKRSIELTRGRLGRVFLLVLCATMVTYATLALFQGPFAVMGFMAGPESAAGFWLTIVGAVLGTIGTTMTSPFMIIGLALIYYDARIREEGFDLELMLASLDTVPDPVRA